MPLNHSFSYSASWAGYQSAGRGGQRQRSRGVQFGVGPFPRVGLVGVVLAALGFAGSVLAQVPTITATPSARQTVIVGRDLSLAVTANGANAFQWKRNGIAVPGATTANYLITGAMPARDSGWYQVTASNGAGSTTSRVIFVNVVVAPARFVVDSYSGKAVVPSGSSRCAAVAVGNEFGLALNGDGTVAAWTVTGSTDYSRGWVPDNLTDVVSIAAGAYHGLALKADGSVAAWGPTGFRDHGQATVPTSLGSVVAIAAGATHSLALKSDGTVVAWGYNSFGQVKLPAGLVGVVAIAAGDGHSLALRSNGTVVAWGLNSSGECTVPDGLTNVVAVAAGGTRSVAVKSDGTVVAWGYNFNGESTVPSGLNNVVSVAVTQNHEFAFRSDGSVVGWGSPFGWGQPAIPANARNVVMVAGGVWGVTSVNVFLTVGAPLSATPSVTSTALAAGAAANFIPVPGVDGLPPYAYTVKQSLPAGLTLDRSTGAVYGIPTGTSAAAPFTIVVTDDLGVTASQTFTMSVTGKPAILAVSGPRQVVPVRGSLALTATAIRAAAYQWKRNGLPIAGATHATYQINGAIPVRDSGWYQVTATNSEGSATSPVIFVNVTVSPDQLVTNGATDNGQGKVPSTITSVAAMAAESGTTLVVQGDGTVVGWGYNGVGEINVPPGLGDVVAVAFRWGYCLALKSDGTVAAWGNGEGPAVVPSGLSDVVAIATGNYYHLALKSDGTVVAWAQGGRAASVPSGLSGVVAISAGSEHSLALKNDGTVVAWGSNRLGETAVPSGLDHVIAIAAGGQHSLALKSDGTVVGWGYNGWGQATPPAGLKGVVGIAASFNDSYVLKSDGYVIAWGLDLDDQTTIPPGLSSIVMITAGSGHNFFWQSAPAGPVFNALPSRRTITVGESAAMTAVLIGTGPFSYQWKKDGVAIAGATSATYEVRDAQVSATGVYSVNVSSALGQNSGTVTTLNVVPSPTPYSRLGNVSVRAATGAGDETLIVGFGVAGYGMKPLLIRGIGPALAAFGVSGAEADPSLRLFNSASVQTNFNDDWGGSTAMMNAFAAVGAFGVSPNSKDAALQLSLVPGVYSVQLASRSGGTALAEAYDCDGEPGTTRLINVSVRTRAGSGDKTLIVGFVIAGNTPSNVLIRAVGPGLRQFGVTDVLADPQMTLFQAGNATAIDQNDNWSGAPGLAAAFAASGAFALAPGSQDAALLTRLQPGAYTVQVSGIGGQTGVVLVELYEAR